MSVDNAKKFMELVAGDTELQSKLAAKDNVDGLVEVANSMGYSFTAADVAAAKGGPTNLTDADLDNVVGAGGRCIGTAKDDPDLPPSTSNATCPGPATTGDSKACGGGETPTTSAKGCDGGGGGTGGTPPVDPGGGTPEKKFF